ncbi:MAG: LamG domain-containing protein, partial [Saprospiraceae bacterium]|nr:LamG domain-containing protein [Saprospiraceae bacterium]
MMRKFPFFILLICSFSFSIKKLEGQIPSNVPKSGLVAWYPFNGNANDESGNGLNGKVDKAILTKDRFGIFNKAYYFDSSRVITIPETVNKNLFPLSVSLWVQIDTSKVSGIGNLFGKYIAASWNGFLIHSTRRVDSVGNVTFKIVPWYIRGANNRLLGLYGEEDFAADLIPGKWHHFVFTVGKDKGNAYLDGKLFDTHLWT